MNVGKPVGNNELEYGRCWLLVVCKAKVSGVE